MSARANLNLIEDTLSWGAAGMVYGVLFNANPLLSALVCSVYAATQGILSKNFQSSRSEDVQVSGRVVSNIACGIAHVVAARHFQLIGESGTVLLSLYHLSNAFTLITNLSNALKRQEAQPGSRY